MKKLFTTMVWLFVCGLMNIYAQENLSSYANFDFVPGSKVMFYDDLSQTIVGEFPNTWSLRNGQAVSIEKQGKKYIAITTGNYGVVAPNFNKSDYLPDEFTVEFEYIYEDQYHPILAFIDANGDGHEVHFNFMAKTGYFDPDLQGTEAFSLDLNGTLHKASLVYKKGQMKCYIDNVRSLVIPNCNFVPKSIEFRGAGGEGMMTLFTNVRIAEGGEMNMWNLLAKEGRFSTQGIYFDVNKAEVKPQSMAVLNEIVKMMKEHPELKLEIGGHTDSDGEEAFNLNLSQKRAEAVKQQLIKMGIAADRFMAKGYGETKPVSDNSTVQGKANNRRVEFVKM